MLHVLTCCRKHPTASSNNTSTCHKGVCTAVSVKDWHYTGVY